MSDASINVVDLNDSRGSLVDRELLLRAESVHRQLRPRLPSDYLGKLSRVFAGGGRMSVAMRDGVVAGVAVYRIYENTFDDLHMYVDDLVTDETKRSNGVGKALLGHLQSLARKAGCMSFTLDSGTQRQQAHKFYFREGLFITSFHFGKTL